MARLPQVDKQVGTGSIAPALYYANVAAIFCFFVCLGIVWFGTWTRDGLASWFIEANALDPYDPEVQKLHQIMPALGKILIVKGILLAPLNLILIFLKRNPLTYVCHWGNLFVMALLVFPIGIPMLRAFSHPAVKREFGLKTRP